jgi:hypothetical protein
LVVLEGAKPDGSGLTYQIDPERMVLVTSEMRSGGQVVLRTRASDYVEVTSGTWLPRHVALWAPDEGGEVRVTVHLARLSTDPDPGGYRLHLDPSIPVEVWPAPSR